MKSTMLLIARTDSESGKLISSNVDISDHEFIVGTTTKGTDSLAHVLAEAEAKGATGTEIDMLEKEWTESHHMCTFNEGIVILHFFEHLAHVSVIQLSRRQLQTQVFRIKPEHTKVTSLPYRASPIQRHAQLQQISWESRYVGTGMVKCFLYRLIKHIYSYSIAPRTREGYYHYTGGVEVKFSLFPVEDDLTNVSRQL